MVWSGPREQARSSFSSSRSALVSGPARLPASASASRTHLRSELCLIPRSLATSAIGRPDSKTRRTARSRCSSGYFFSLGIDEGSPVARTEHPGVEVSVKTRLAQEEPLRFGEVIDSSAPSISSRILRSAR